YWARPTGSAALVSAFARWNINPNDGLSVRAGQRVCEIACWPPRSEFLRWVEAFVKVATDKAAQQRVHTVLLVQRDSARETVAVLQRFQTGAEQILEHGF